MAKSRGRPRAVRAPVVVNNLALSANQEQVWRVANEDIGSGELPRMKRGLAALRALEGELGRAVSDASVRLGLAESVALETARGEKVDVARRPMGFSRVRVRTRDGLDTLQRAGAISSTQYRAGLAYRDLYEATDPERDLRSHMESLERRGGSGEGVAEAWAERRLRLSRTVAAIEAKVRLADRNDRAVQALREVAGHARCIGAMLSGGGSQAAYKRALITALDVCAAHFGMA
ncbi:MAG: hypothetical protein P4L73_12140 [Caulobacteraceae bacterium]|nr:hypothetical protein [Caulobacteraceae bacterium]